MSFYTCGPLSQAPTHAQTAYTVERTVFRRLLALGATLWRRFLVTRAAGRPETGPRPRPEGKELRATLEGQAVARCRLAQRVAPRQGPHIQPRVALSDGAEARQQQVVGHVPQHTLGLESIQAPE